MIKMRALIIDDEAPARSEMAFLLEQTKRIDVVGEAASVLEAVEIITSTPLDVLFLDINMPASSGLQIAESLLKHPAPPAIVFVTAHSQFALKAFELNAVDYLMKPVSLARLETALTKVELAHTATSSPAVQNESDVLRITATRGGAIHYLEPSDIIYFKSQGDYSIAYTKSGHFFITSSLNFLEKKLSSGGFLRVHRSYLLNLSFIKSISSVANGALVVTVEDEENVEIPVSRRRAAELKAAADTAFIL